VGKKLEKVEKQEDKGVKKGKNGGSVFVPSVKGGTHTWHQKHWGKKKRERKILFKKKIKCTTKITWKGQREGKL